MTIRSRRHPSPGAGVSPVSGILTEHLGDAASERLDEGERLYVQVMDLLGLEAAASIIERAAQAWARGSAFEVPWLHAVPHEQTATVETVAPVLRTGPAIDTDAAQEPTT